MAKHKKKLSKSESVGLFLLGLLGFGLSIAFLLQGTDIALFNPKGLIASEQHHLMVTATFIMLGIAVPTLFLLYFFAWKYRETNQKATTNHPTGNHKFQAFVYWAIPTGIMLILASLMLPATQKLEPQRSIAASNQALTVQVVALRWKWLFIYPGHNIATVNYVQIPVDTPVQFELTADEAPMNSFWIPHLGGQLYAMTGHQNRLNLIAEKTGDYTGSAAEINGAGFAGMRFVTRVSSEQDFEHWVNETQQSNQELSVSEYEKLLHPSENNQAAFYKDPDPELYGSIITKYAGSHNHPADQGAY
jgi:cytochrome o ubiquinol oxidase subunit 2